MPVLRAFIANCLMRGETTTEYDGSFARDTVEFHCEGRVFKLAQQPGIIGGRLSDLDGHAGLTSLMTVVDVAAEDVETVLGVIDRICWLLSFACMSRVERYGYDLGDRAAARRPILSNAQYFRPTLNLHDGGEVRQFVELSLSAFTALETTRKLPVAIDYILQADNRSLPVECKLVFTFVVLENLKHTYAHANQYPFLRGRFREHAPLQSKSVTFRPMLERMFAHVGMSPPGAQLEDIVALRNDLIHSGISAVPHVEQLARFEVAMDIIREYLLRLIGYRGAYSRYSSGGRVRDIIS